MSLNKELETVKLNLNNKCIECENLKKNAIESEKRNRLLQLKSRLYLKQISIFQNHRNYDEIQRIQDEKKIKELEALIQLNELSTKKFSKDLQGEKVNNEKLK